MSFVIRFPQYIIEFSELLKICPKLKKIIKIQITYFLKIYKQNF